MEIHRRGVLTGAAAAALASVAPAGAALADPASFKAADWTQASFRLRRRPQALDYAFCDPWLVRVAQGEPQYLIHELSGVTFRRRPSGELEAQGAWSSYAPPYLLVSLVEGPDGKPQRQGISLDPSTRDFEDADARDLESLLLAAHRICALCGAEARRQGDGFLKLRPASTRYGDVKISSTPASGYGAPAGASFPRELRAREDFLGQG